MTTPDNSHFVYHVTTVDRAERCLEEGIIPYYSTESRPETLLLDADYDSARPDVVRELEVTRLSSVYAHPDYEHALRRRNGGWLNRTERKLAVLSIYVPDLTQAYVCDGLLNAEPYTAKEYWESFMTLASYRDQDEPMFTVPHPRYPKKFIYMWPEVLLSNGVAADRVSLEEDLRI